MAISNITKPYTFVENTKADPAKVNSDFDIAYTAINEIIDELPSLAPLAGPTFTGIVTIPASAVIGAGATIGAGAALATPVLTNPTVTNYIETLYAPAAGSVFTVDLANGTIQKFTSDANITITLPASAAGKSYMVIVALGGTHTITFNGGSTIKWSGGSAPATSASGNWNIYCFTCDGTYTFGANGGRAF